MGTNSIRGHLRYVLDLQTFAEAKSEAKPNILDRKDFQGKESYPEHSSDLPEDRAQKKKQVAPSQDVVTNPSTTPVTIPAASPVQTQQVAKEVLKSVSVQPNADIDILSGKQVGGVTIQQAVQALGVAGTSLPSVAADASKMPYTEGGRRPTDRFGKKNSIANFLIDNSISEQVAPKFDEVPDLRKDPNAEVGYNGNKQFTTARGKKNAGSLPQQLLFDRSIDMDHSSYILHATGQVLDSIPTQSDYPTTTTIADMAESGATPDDNGYYDIAESKRLHKGNYLIKDFVFTIDANGHLSAPHFVERQFVSHVNSQDSDVANFNHQVDANNVLAAVLRLQAKNGHETMDHWSPLAWVIDQPYQYNMLAHDLEATLGAMEGIAYRASAYSIAMNLNLIGKEGAKPVTPIYRMFHDGIRRQVNSTAYDSETRNLQDGVFGNDEMLQAGSAAALIKMFDSTQKYSTKADIFNQSRSLKMWLQAVDNNIDPLHAKKHFFEALNDVTYFSTPDGIYNPMLPLYVTDYVQMMLPMSLQFFLEGWSRPVVFDGTNTGTQDKFNYVYTDQRNTYRWSMKNPLVEGLLRWLLTHESQLVKAYGKNTTITWPCKFSFTEFGMFQFVMCAASYDTAMMRSIIFRDILDAGSMDGYIWDDLTSMKTLNPLQATQLSYTDYASPLKPGKLSDTAKIRLFWPETFQTRYNTRGAGGAATLDYVLPWYMSEDAITNTSDTETGFTNTDTPHLFNYPSRRSGVNSAIFDTIYKLTPQDLLLGMDRMVRIPYPTIKTQGLFGSGSSEKYVADIDHATSSYLKVVAMRYDAMASGRVVLTVDHSVKITNAALLEAPRQFGYIFPNCGVDDELYSGATKVSATVSYNSPLCENVSRYIEAYRADGNITAGGAATGIIDRSAALHQVSYRFFARRDPAVVTANCGFEDATGIIPCFSGLFKAATTATDPGLSAEDATAKCIYPLHGKGDTSLVSDSTVITLSRFFWTSIQRFYIPVNPFEGCLDEFTHIADTSDINPSAGTFVDNMEYATYFGWAGFMACDYNQLALNRLNQYEQLTITYTEDVLISKSKIFSAQ